ncbi:NPCBM/NEW2 domain-containing protein [Deinococcus sp.]|uniref:NPCBM/NEW2 domain-containing protein n=1 Tax=Deinococcus sp. TaxID=47478 RepID=UPI003B5B9D9C
MTPKLSNAARVRPLVRRFLPAGLALLTFGLSACNSANESKAPAAPSAVGEAEFNGAEFNYDGLDHAWQSGPQANLGALTLDPGDNSLSFENWISASNGWGPIERNRSSGEKNAGDGRTLTLNGKTYDKGFGVHASSSMTFNIGAKCSTFTSDIGIDDEVGNKGSVVFQVFADGSKIYDSGKMTGSSATKRLKLDVSGKKELRLVVTDAGDGLSYDHADWAAPMLLKCGSAITPPPVVPPTTPPAPVVSPYAQKVLELSNAARAIARTCADSKTADNPNPKSGFFPAVAPLTLSDQLAQSAQGHATDMASRDYFSHDSLDGRSFDQRITQAGYAWRTIGENIAAGQQTPEAVVSGWLSDYGHCANIMNASYTNLGVGYAEGGSYGKYWVQDFGAPR